MQSTSKKSAMPPLWFGIYGHECQEVTPAFFDDAVLPFADELKSALPLLKQVVEPLMAADAGEFRPYFEEDLQSPPRNWKMIGLRAWGKDDTANLARFPDVATLLQKIPGLVSASFSLLAPHSRILPHHGETNAIYRIHLGIKVPRQAELCTFKVKDEARSWREGELLIFVDANRHEARNDTDEARCILLLDVVRPEFLHLRRQICVQALSRLSLFFVLSKLPGFPAEKLKQQVAHIPDGVIDLACAPFKLILNLLWLLRRWGLNSH